MDEGIRAMLHVENNTYILLFYEFSYQIILSMKLNYKVNVYNIYCENVQHVHSIKNSMPRYCEYEWKWKYAYIPVNIIIGIIIFGKYIS